MADDGAGANANANRGNRLASFKIPYAWDNNAPKFVTEDYEDLMTFIDHVNQILSLAGLTDDQAMKEHLTSYLPARKKANWRALTSYDVPHSYADFLKEVYKGYPEIGSERTGTLDYLSKWCKKHKGLSVQDEGSLRRFGMEFLTTVKKLFQEPAIITNQAACKMYLETLDRTFAATINASVNAATLVRTQLGIVPPAPVLAAGAAAANATSKRKEDPIEIEALIKIAETMAATYKEDTADLTINEPRRSGLIPAIKLESRDERVDGITHVVSDLKEQFDSSERQRELQHAEVLKTLQQLANQ